MDMTEKLLTGIKSIKLKNGEENWFDLCEPLLPVFARYL